LVVNVSLINESEHWAEARAIEWLSGYFDRREIGFDGEAWRRLTARVDFEIIGNLSRIMTIATW
jgi:hypothetical protein